MSPNPVGLVMRGALIGLIRLYQWVISPLIGPHCRHAPTCSSYALEAIGRHGAWAGSWLAVARILRCHPWGSQGFDPVPVALERQPVYLAWRYGRWSLGGGEKMRQDF